MEAAGSTEARQDRKVLIVTYYWPPSGGSGVQRWLKFVKYLPGFGWQPFVYTPENPHFEIRDESLLKDIPPGAEVLRLPIWEPYALFRKASAITGTAGSRQVDMVKTGKRPLYYKVVAWIRGNLFIPDARRFWVKPSVAFLSDLMVSNEIRTLVTTGPPHSMHLIGLKLKKKIPSIHWVADMRDPWSEWDLLDTLSLTGYARRQHRKLEREVLQAADRVVTIAPFHAARFEQLSGRKVDVITNGFDDEDFTSVAYRRTSKFTIRHIGMVDELRDPRPFMEALKELLKDEPRFRGLTVVEFIGSVNRSFRDYVAADPLLSEVTRFRDPVRHAELLQLYGETDMQLLILAHTVLAPGNLPGKIFEYLASGNFIFGVGPSSGDAAWILNESSAGAMRERDDREGMLVLLRQRMERWAEGGAEPARNVQAYSRRNLTGKLIDLLEPYSS